MSKINYGIIGYGWVGEVHCKLLDKLKDKINIKGICDINPLKAERGAKRFGTKPFVEYKDLLDSGLDAVSICTPHHLHFEMCMDSLKRDINILCEKPCVISFEELEKLQKKVKESSAILAAILPHRFEPVYSKLKNYIDNKKLGEVISGGVLIKWKRETEYYTGEYSWRAKKATAGSGVLMTQAIHSIDLMQWFMNGVKSVYGKCSSISPSIEVEDNAIALIEYNNSAFGVLDCSTSANPSYGKSLQVIGTKNTVILNDGRIEKWGGLNDEEIKKENEKILELESQISWEKHFGYGNIFQMNDFIDAILNNREPLIGLNDARKSIEVILKILESSEKEKKIYLS